MKRNRNGDGSVYYDSKNDRYIGQLSTASGRKSFTAKDKRSVQLKMLAYSSAENEALLYKKYTTLGSYASTWFTTYKIHDYKTATYQKEKRRLALVLSESGLGDVLLQDLTPLLLQEYVNGLEKIESPKTIRNKFALLNGCLRQAALDGLLRINPAASVRLPKSKKPDIVALTQEELDVFFAINASSPYAPIFKFACLTGLRISEICGLQKSDVRYDLRMVSVSKQLVRLKGSLVLDSPKTSNGVRMVPLNDEALAICRSFAAASRSDFLFYNPVSKKRLVQNTLSINAHRCFLRAYDATKKEAYYKASFHSFRHSFATMWIVRGGNPALLSKCLGHSDPNFTLRVYVQPDFSDVLNEFEKLKI